MAQVEQSRSEQTYLVEHYRPGLDGRRALAVGRAGARDRGRDGAARARRCATSRAAIVPADETLLCVLEAATEELVRETYARAGIPFERLSAVIPEGADGWAAHANE